MENKICRKCGTEKKLEEMSKDKSKKSGHSNMCKLCTAYDRKAYREDNLEKIKNKKRQYYIKNKEETRLKNKAYRNKNLESLRTKNKKYRDKNSEKLSIKKKKYRENNLEKVKAQQKAHYNSNSDKILEKEKIYRKENSEKKKITDRTYRNKSENKEKTKKYNKEYKEENREYFSNYGKTYTKKRSKVDVLFKLKINVRATIGIAIRKSGYKKGGKTFEILKCSVDEFKKHIESKFESWMTWENHGKYNGQLNYGWDLDHIIPISSAKTEDEVYKLNCFTNFQPLCSYINRYIKRDKYLN